MKPCLFCKEDIHDEAVKCKHCQSMVDPEQPAFQSGSRQVVYFVDRDLVVYIKVAVGVVSLVVAIVTFGFGLNLWRGSSSVATMKEKVEEHVDKAEEHAKTLEGKVQAIAALENKAIDSEERIRNALTSVEFIQRQLKGEFVTEKRVREIVAELEKTETLPTGETIEIGYPNPRKVQATDELKNALSKLTEHVSMATNILNKFFPKHQRAEITIALLESSYNNTIFMADKIYVNQDVQHLPEIVYHEVSRSYIDATTKLLYKGQSGALTESFADIFAELIDQAVNNKTARTGDWIIAPGAVAWLKGQDVLTTEPRLPLTSLRKPGTAYKDDPLLGTDSQVDHMSRLYNGPADMGGVHINKGIPNRAFYAAAIQIGSDDAQRIWVETLIRLSPESDFNDAAQMTIEVATELFKPNSRQVRAVLEAWRVVGVIEQPETARQSSL